ncbi:type I restriction-modification system subunit M N-terminal domain-containing protein, partial [Rhizobium hidalgonense]
MSQVQLQQLQKQLWNIANDLRGKMGADEFRDYILGFIFYKYLSEKSVTFANELLVGEQLDGQEINFLNLNQDNPEHAPYIQEIKKNSIAEVGYALTPQQLFHRLAQR